MWAQLFWKIIRLRVRGMTRALNFFVDIKALTDGWTRMVRFMRCLHPMDIANYALLEGEGIAWMDRMGGTAAKWKRGDGSD